MPKFQTSRITRREFLAASAAVGTGLAMARQSEAAPLKTTLHKALIGTPNLAVMEQWKTAGFEGFEWGKPRLSPKEAAHIRQRAESVGLRVHSVMFGWGNVNQGDAAMAKTVADMETALRAAEAFGADTVLFVPCRIDVQPMPEPWQFDIRFDEKTGYLKQVVAGDNSRYQKYIQAHDHAVDATRQAVRKLIPTAEKTNVIIALENVWNNLWVKPQLAANLVASFNHPWVRAYFDIGNHVKYAPPQEWIHTLGRLIVKCHVKDFKLNPNGHGGRFCTLREGSIDWPAVRMALDAIGYNGWLSIEENNLTPREYSKRLDLIIAGK